MTGKKFVTIMIESSKKRTDAWRLKAHALDQEQIEILEKSLTLLDNDEEKVKSLILNKKNDLSNMNHEDEFSNLLIKLSESLFDDLSVYTKSRYDDILDISGLGIIEIGKIHAGITNKNHLKEELDGFAIFINIGTYYALQLLIKAIIVENFENEFEQYRQDGNPYIDLAMTIYKTQHSHPTREIFWHDFPNDVQANASAAQSASVIKIMQFIALHELGHYVNGDFDIMGFHSYAMHSNDNNKIHDELLRVKSYNAEFKADNFAFNALFDTEIDDLSKWSSFYPIFYFYAWLNAIEKKDNIILSDMHPNPLERARILQKKLLELTDDEDYGYSIHLDNVVEYFNKWSQK